MIQSMNLKNINIWMNHCHFLKIAFYFLKFYKPLLVYCKDTCVYKYVFYHIVPNLMFCFFSSLVYCEINCLEEWRNEGCVYTCKKIFRWTDFLHSVSCLSLISDSVSVFIYMYITGIQSCMYVYMYQLTVVYG